MTSSSTWRPSLVAFFLIGTLMALTEQVLAQNIVFGTCQVDVRNYFSTIFPEYNSRRRLRVLEETNAQSLDDVFFSRGEKFFRSHLTRSKSSSSSSSDNTAASSTGSAEETSLGSGVLKRIPKPLPTADSYVPPFGAWDQMRMAASGCTSCTNGCCDAVDVDLDCGVMEVPLDYSNLTGPTIQISVYRVRLVTPQFLPSNRTHLWILQGGPGGSGLSILPLAIPSLQFASDIYIPDHRGTAFSSELECPIQQSSSSAGGSSIDDSEVSSCYNYGNNVFDLDFRKFTVTAAARDLEKMISSAKSLFAPAAVYVHGYSYGTRWAQRFLQLFPNAVDKVVLEGVVAKDTVFNDFAIGSQTAGERFMNKCLVNSKCSQFFSSTSLSSTIAAIVAQGTNNICSLIMCGDTITTQTVREGMQFLLYDGLVSGVDGPYKNVTGFPNQDLFVDFRTFSLALVSHWQRCTNPSSFRAFAAGFSYLLSFSGGLTGQLSMMAKKRGQDKTAALDESDLFNDIVYGMIAYSDLRRYPMDSLSTYNAAHANVDWATVVPHEDELDLSNAWEAVKYPADAFMGNAPLNVESDVLFINGEIDGQTPRSQAFDAFSEMTVTGTGSKTIAAIRDQGHYASGFGCGLSVAKSFYAGSVDTSCAMASENEPVQPLATNFEIPPPFSATLFGQTAAFDGSEVSGFCESPTGTGAAGERSCDRCFDYCLLRADNGELSYCSCLSALSQCYTKAQLLSPVGTCQLMQQIYDNAFTQPIFLGCASACSSSLPFGLSSIIIAVIAAGAAIAFLFTVLLVVVLMRRRASQPGVVVASQNTGGQIVMAMPATAVLAAPGTTGGTVVAAPTGSRPAVPGPY